jgi:hypothetical protein
MDVAPRWAAAAVGVCGLLAYLGALVAGVHVWSSSPDEQHGFLVIPITLALLYLRRGTFPRDAVGVDLRGLSLLAVAAAMRVPGVAWVDTEEAPGKPHRFRRWVLFGCRIGNGANHGRSKFYFGFWIVGTESKNSKMSHAYLQIQNRHPKSKIN